MLFDILLLMLSWLPTPLNIIVFGGICILFLVACIKLVTAIIDMIPFL